MIKSIRLKNFQIHADTTLDFCPGINAITGDSDEGKSSFMRGFRWVNENRPLNNSFCSKFAGDNDTEVVVEVEEGIITRTKGRKKNCYKVGAGAESLAGTTVPAEVAALLNLSPVNFQFQMDAPFLLSLHSSKLSQYINEEARLDVIDTARSSVRKQALDNNQQQRSLTIVLDGIKNSLKEFSDLEVTEGKLVSAEALERALRNKKKLSANLTSLLKAISNNSEKVKLSKAEVSCFGNTIEVAHLRQQDIQKKKKTLMGLQSLLLSLASNKNKISQTKIKAKILAPIVELCGDFEDAKEIKQKKNSLQVLLTSISDKRLSVNQLKTKAKALENEYRESIPNTCPTCGQYIDKNLPVPLQKRIRVRSSLAT